MHTRYAYVQDILRYITWYTHIQKPKCILADKHTQRCMYVRVYTYIYMHTQQTPLNDLTNPLNP